MHKNYKLLGNYLFRRSDACLIIVFAFFYYASYYRCGLNLGGEGGTAGVIALRLLEGQRPIADTFIGYNVLWFYPIAWLFQVFGANYLVVKIYFFTICAFTALIATLLVRQATRYFWLAALTGILLVMVPGMQFRNYMAFLAVLNILSLYQVFIFSHKTGWQKRIWRIIAGLVLGVTYLIRIDVGFFITLVMLLLCLVFPLSTESGFKRGILLAFKALLTIVICALALHLPLFWDAHQRGFRDQFIGQYTHLLNYIHYRATLLTESFKEPAPSLLLSQAEEPQRIASAAPSIPAEEVKATLSRPPLSDLFHDRSVVRMFVWALYLPVPIIIWMIIGMGGIWLAAVWTSNYEDCQRVLGVLMALGCTLALFPQYFFFRPDTPHLSEFMAPFMVTMVLGCSQAFRIAQRKRHVLAWGYALILALLCTTSVIAHVYNGLKRESSGSIAARKNCTKEFTALNGVHVFVREKDFPTLQGLYSSIMAHSEPTDWVVCYPYSPTVNFMTNRRSYEFNLYVDNATKPKNFDEKAIQKFHDFRPAVIVISDYALNKNSVSRFKNWAASTYEFIKTHYRLVGTYGFYEVYVPFEAHNMSAAPNE